MNNFKNTLQFLGIAFKKVVVMLVIVNLVMAGIITALAFLIDQTYLVIFFAFIALFVDYFLISSFSTKKNKIIKEKEDEFVSIISYFKIFIANKNNVYHSFECVIPYCSDFMANEIQNLLSDIDRDKTVQPFITFAKQFNNPTIENVMLSIFQMIDEGESVDRLSQFSFSFEQFSREHKELLIDSKQKSFDSMNTFPLIGAGTMTMMLTFSILTILGDLTNVI